MKISIRKNCLALITVLISIYDVSAQTNFKEGWILLRNGDSLGGQIDYRNWAVNPLKIRFKSPSSENFYTANDLQSFEIIGQDKYKSAIIVKDMRPVDIASLSKMGDEEKSVTDTAFLRVLVNGSRVSLFELVDEKTHFFIQEHDSLHPQELIFKKYVSADNMYLQEKAVFRNQLNKLALENHVSNLADKIEKCNYDQSDLRVIIRALNGEEFKVVKAAEKKKKQGLQLMIGGGPQFYSFSFEGENSKWTQLQFQNKVGPVVAIAVDVFAGRNAQKLALRFELSYSQFKFDGSYNSVTTLLNYHQQYSYHITQNNITPQIKILYHFLNQENLRMYCGVGVGLNFSSYPINVYNEYTVETGENRTTESPLEFRDKWVSNDILLGARIYKRINLGLSTKLFGGFVDYNSLSGKLFPVAFTASYILVNRKGSSD